MVNLVLIILLSWLGIIFSMNGRSHGICQMITLQLFSNAKSCAYWKTSNRCFINSIPRVELSKREVT